MKHRIALSVGQRPSESHSHTHITMVDPSVEKGARFLDEVQTKAHDRIKDVLVIDVPGFDAKLVSYDLEYDLSSARRQHRIAFKLNGQTMDLQVKEKPNFGDKDEAFRLVADEIAVAILRQVRLKL